MVYAPFMGPVMAFSISFFKHYNRYNVGSFFS